MFSLINRDVLPKSTLDEFEHFIASVKSVFLTEHNEDGTHLITPRGFDFVPVGAVMVWSTDTAPDGWVLCRGQQLSRVDYKGLFDVIGTTYGAGNGTTTFNVPDLQQRFPLGKAVSGTGASLAATGGAIDHAHAGPSHTHSTPPHSHSVSITTSSDGSHTHTGTTDTTPNATSDTRNTSAPDMYAFSVTQHSHTFTTGSGGSHSHGVSGSTASDGSGTTGSGGSGDTGTANPPFLTLNYIILTGVAA